MVVWGKSTLFSIQVDPAKQGQVSRKIVLNIKTGDSKRNVSHDEALFQLPLATLLYFLVGTIPPGATQFDVAPVSAKFISVPFLPFPLESKSVSTAALFPPAIP